MFYQARKSAGLLSWHHLSAAPFCASIDGHSKIQTYYNISVFWIYFMRNITCRPRVYFFGFLRINAHEYLQRWAKMSIPIPTSKANE